MVLEKHFYIQTFLLVTDVQEMAQAALEAGFQNLQKLLPRNPGEAEITSKVSCQSSIWRKEN